MPAKTRKLASTINADIVQAEPLETGTVDQVIIPPGTLNPEKTTIVSIPQPPQPSPQQQRMMHESSQMASSTMAPASTSIANKSAQVINESLDEQVSVTGDEEEDDGWGALDLIAYAVVELVCKFLSYEAVVFAI